MGTATAVIMNPTRKHQRSKWGAAYRLTVWCT